MTSFKIVPNTTQSTEVKVISNTESHNVTVTGFGGPKGEQGIQGVQGIQGEQGLSGVISVESPITNTGTDTEAILGIDQALLEIEESQVVNLVSDLASKETPSGAQSKADTAQANAKTYADTTFEPKTSNRFVPSGGTAGQILSKNTNTNYDTGWIDNYTSDVRQWIKNDGAALTKGTPVYISASNGANMIVSSASNTTELTSSKTLGLLAQDLAINASGWVITEGLLGGLNTSTATAGDPVWLGTNGTLIYGIANKPISPAHLVFIGIVTRVQSQNGEIFVKVQNGYEIEELHNVLINSKQDSDLISYDSTSGLWKNKNFATLGLLTSAVAASIYAPIASPTFTGTISATDMNVSGTLTIGTYNILNTTNLSVTDSIIYLANNQFDTDILDIGFYGAYGDSNPGHFHTGLVRDHSDGIWKLFSNGNEPSGETIDLTSVTYDTLKVGSLKINNGTSNQFLKADGSLDNSNYLTVGNASSTYLTQSYAASTYAALSGSQTLNGNQTIIPATSSGIALTLTGKPSQSADYIYIQNDVSTNVFRMTASGSGYFLGNISAGVVGGLGTTRLSILSGSSTTIGAIIRGAASQTANMLEIQDSSGTIISNITASGRINGSIFGSTASGKSYIETAATGNSIGIQTNAPTNTGLRIQGAASQTANLLEWQDSSGTQLGYILSSGSIYTAGRIIAGTDLSSKIQATSSTATQISLILRGAVSQTANLTEWQNSAGTVLARVASDGAFYAGGLSVFANGNTTNSNTFTTSYLTTNYYATIGGSQPTGSVALVIKGVASQIADLTQWQDSGGNTLLSVKPNTNGNWTSDVLNAQGPVQINPANGSATGYGLYVRPGAVGSVGTLVRGMSSQTADLSQWQNSSGTILASVTNGGALTTTSYIQNTAANTPYIDFTTANKLIIQTRNAGYIGLTIKGAASQTANLQEWQDSSGNVLAKVSSNGNFTMGPNLVFTDPGVGNATSFTFTKNSDAAWLKVTERATDQTTYEFGMSDNPDGSDYFQWRWDDWQNGASGWMPIQLTGFNNRFIARNNNIYGNLVLPYNSGFYTYNNTANPTDIEVNKYTPGNSTTNQITKDAGSGTGTLTIDVTNFNGTGATSYWIVIDGAGTFKWGTGSYQGAATATGVVITGSAQTLSNNVTVTLSLTGHAVNDRWSFRAFPAMQFGLGGTISGAMAAIQPSSATKGLIIKGATSQSANLIEVQDSSGTVLSGFTSSGNLVIGRSSSLGSNNPITIQSNTGMIYYSTNNTSLMTTIFTSLRGNSTGNNMSLASKGDTANGVASLSFLNTNNNELFSILHQGWAFFANSTAPSSNPTNGGYLYVDTGALKYRGTSGSATTLANADGSSTVPVASTTTSGTVKVDGTTIVINGSGVISSTAVAASLIPTFIQNTAPAVAPGTKYMWWDTTNGNLSLWIEDGT